VLRSLLVNRHSDIRQSLVSCFFFVERSLEQTRRLIQTRGPSHRTSCPITSDLVMLHLLSSRDEGEIFQQRIRYLLAFFVRLRDEALDAGSDLATTSGCFADHLENLAQACYVLLRFHRVLLQR
jgi:hypothetical protein